MTRALSVGMESLYRELIRIYQVLSKKWYQQMGLSKTFPLMFNPLGNNYKKDNYPHIQLLNSRLRRSNTKSNLHQRQIKLRAKFLGCLPYQFRVRNVLNFQRNRSFLNHKTSTASLQRLLSINQKQICIQWESVIFLIA